MKDQKKSKPGPRPEGSHLTSREPRRSIGWDYTRHRSNMCLALLRKAASHIDTCRSVDHLGRNKYNILERKALAYSPCPADSMRCVWDRGLTSMHDGVSYITPRGRAVLYCLITERLERAGAGELAERFAESKGMWSYYRMYHVPFIYTKFKGEKK